MSSLLTYWQAIKSKPGLKPGETIPRFEKTLDARPASRRLYNGLRSAWDLPDYGVLPPVFPAVATFMTHLSHLANPRFPFQAMGTVHKGTKIQQVRAMRVDENVSFRCWVEGHRPVDRGVEFDMHTEAAIQNQVVSHTMMTMFRRTQERRLGPKKSIHLVNNDLNGHDLFWQVDQMMARHYAWLTGDMNPIHLSTMAARAFGFHGMILHGMWLLGKACAMHPVLLLRDHLYVESEFRSPVVLPSSLRYRWWEKEADQLEFRILDDAGARAHVIGRIQHGINNISEKET